MLTREKTMALNDNDISPLTRFATVLSVIQEAPVLLHKDQKATRIKVIEAMRDDWAYVISLNHLSRPTATKPKATDADE
jgi:hypothetical protein